jgi:CheY-like chemotaxis protein
VDRSFVSGIGDRDRPGGDRAIVAGVIDLAHAFGMTTIAEGVETDRQRAILETLGCEQGQGYFWSQPRPATEIVDWIERYAHPSAQNLAAASGPTRILVVEDDCGLRELLCTLFAEDPAYAVVANASDGREAVALARHHQPDIVILDLAMPGMGGLEALPLLRAVAPAAKVIVDSGLDDPQLEAQVVRGGASAFVHKVGGLDGLRRTVQQVSSR